MNKKTLYNSIKEQDLLHWIKDSASTFNWLTTLHLSERFRAAIHPYHFNVLSEVWQLPLDFEAELLALSCSELAWIRCSAHYDAARPIVQARVVVPHQTFIEHQDALVHLKGQRIGETLLFNRSEVERGPFFYWPVCALVPSGIELLEGLDAGWLRSSIFFWNQKPLLITEIFSKLLPPYPD